MPDADPGDCAILPQPTHNLGGQLRPRGGCLRGSSRRGPSLRRGLYPLCASAIAAVVEPLAILFARITRRKHCRSITRTPRGGRPQVAFDFMPLTIESVAAMLDG